MPSYRVIINDNAHYMDESERADHGVVFADADEAVAACKALRVVWAGPVCGAGQSKRS
jgi:hypothetical protein